MLFVGLPITHLEDTDWSCWTLTKHLDEQLEYLQLLSQTGTVSFSTKSVKGVLKLVFFL